MACYSDENYLNGVVSTDIRGQGILAVGGVSTVAINKLSRDNVDDIVSAVIETSVLGSYMLMTIVTIFAMIVAYKCIMSRWCTNVDLLSHSLLHSLPPLPPSPRPPPLPLLMEGSNGDPHSQEGLEFPDIDKDIDNEIDAIDGDRTYTIKHICDILASNGFEPEFRRRDELVKQFAMLGGRTLE